MPNTEYFTPPKTARVYLHQPHSNRAVLLFPDFKVVNLELTGEKHTRQSAVGFILLHGQDNTAVDFKATTFSDVLGGIPIYTVNAEEECLISLEAFCSFDENPITYARVTLKNTKDHHIEDSVAILPRKTTDDVYLTNLDDTGYCSYNPGAGSWFMLNSSWKDNGGNHASDSESSLRIETSLSVKWMPKSECPIYHKASDYYKVSYSLDPNESVSFDLVFALGEVPAKINFDSEKEKVISRWNEILSDIKVVPNSDSQNIQGMYRHLAAQSLQMLAKYSDSPDLITPRQGDVGRYVWPWEAAMMLTALDHAGLTSWTGDAYKYFIEKWLVKEGEDKGKVMSCHQQWGNLNGSLVWGISYHLLHTHDRAEFEYFRPYLNMMLDWMESERERSSEFGELYSGIFPTGKASDWRTKAQYWCFTDGQNVMGYEKMAELYKEFDDPDSDRVAKCFENYLGTLQDIARDVYKGHENDECFFFPHQLGVAPEEALQYCYYTSGAIYLFFSGIIPYTSREFEQMDNYYNFHGMFDRGLAGRMTNFSVGDGGLYGDIFYTVNAEQMWLKGYMARGEQAKADEMFDAVMKYCITSEYIVSERYCSRDPWYSPWQPNASSCGRMMDILLTYFGETNKQ
ncbi:MAG: hypothetical protein E7672_08905 [Ruminococcaceae bacterium]|nr:hypothetical protein [Oscillospiraceae bacterium]